MIREVDIIPGVDNTSKIREQIFTDFEEALACQIYTFELEGYKDYENLRDKIKNSGRSFFRNLFREYKKDFDKRNHIEEKTYAFLPSDLFNCYTRKGEEHRRVFVNINRNYKQMFEEECKKAVEREKARKERENV